MKLYAGTTEQFRADARLHRIAEKLRAAFTTQIGHRPAPSEVASWQNSLMALWSDGTIGPSTADARSNVLVTDIAFSVIIPASVMTGG